MFQFSPKLSIYIPWPFPPVWGVADNTKETTKTMGVSLRSSSNDEGSNTNKNEKKKKKKKKKKELEFNASLSVDNQVYM